MARATQIEPFSPLGMTLEAFEQACACEDVGPGRAKMAYHSVFRDGLAHSAPAKITVPEIVKRHEELVDEGVTIKFVQRLPNPNHRLRDQGIDFDDIEPGMDEPNGAIIAQCEHFIVEQHELSSGSTISTPGDQFSILTVVSGQLSSKAGRTFQSGDFLLLPRGADPLQASGDSRVLRTYLP